MLDPSLTTAFARTEKEVVDLAAANPYMKDELAVFRRRARMSFYSQVSPVWLMEHAERAALSMLVQLIKPRVVIEIGTRFGGSAFLFSQHAERVICIDVDYAVTTRCAGVPNIEVVIGSSRQKVPEILASLRRDGADFDLALIDGDHTADGVRADIEAFIAMRPTRPAWLVLHDTFNPTVRSGIKSVNWDKPWVSQVEIDFVPGNLMSDPHVNLQMWGGIGVVELSPADRTGALDIREECRLLYDAALNASVHASKAS